MQERHGNVDGRCKKEPSSSIRQDRWGPGRLSRLEGCAELNEAGRWQWLWGYGDKLLLLYLIAEDAKVSTLCCCDSFLFCFVFLLRNRWNFLLFSEIIIIHTEDKIFEAFFFFLFLLGQTHLSQTLSWAMRDVHIPVRAMWCAIAWSIKRAEKWKLSVCTH